MTTEFPLATSKLKGKNRPHALSIYWKETKYEFLKRFRMPTYSLSVLFFPVLFYSLFGLILNRNMSIHHVSVATYMMATMACYGVVAVALFGFGVGLAIERGQGWLEVKRASPMPYSAYFVGRLGTCLLFSFAVALLLLLIGATFGGVRLQLGQAALLILTLVLGSIPFCALGLTIGYFAKPNSAASIVNLIYVPIAFVSGFWIPIDVLPHWLRNLALALPTYHFGQLALSIVGAGSTRMAPHIEVLAGFTLICLGIARLGFQRDEGKLYG